MRPLGSLALALVLATLPLGCGAESAEGSTRATNPNNTNPAGIGPAGGAAPPPRESIGGRGRGVDPIRGK
jgi:hypothetical protein